MTTTTLDLIANHLTAELGHEFDIESTGGNCRALVTYRADGTVLVVTEEAVAVYPTEAAWQGETDDEPRVLVEGNLSRNQIATAVRAA